MNCNATRKWNIYFLKNFKNAFRAWSKAESASAWRPTMLLLWLPLMPVVVLVVVLPVLLVAVSQAVTGSSLGVHEIPAATNGNCIYTLAWSWKTSSPPTQLGQAFFSIFFVLITMPKA